MIDLSKETKKVYSQFNQDGVLESIFNNIGTTNKYFVEFGSDGTDEGQGNTPFLRHEFGFDGLLMDGTLHKEKRKYELHREFIRADTINETFEKYNVPKEFDFLSIDIDGQDFYVMQSIDLTKFSPRVVSIETNPAIPAPHSLVQRYDPNWIWEGWHFYGCSIEAITKLMNQKNYSLVCYCGVDAIFVENSCCPDKYFENINDTIYHYKNGVVDPDGQTEAFNIINKYGEFFVV